MAIPLLQKFTKLSKGLVAANKPYSLRYSRCCYSCFSPANVKAKQPSMMESKKATTARTKAQRILQLPS